MTGTVSQLASLLVWLNVLGFVFQHITYSFHAGLPFKTNFTVNEHTESGGQ